MVTIQEDEDDDDDGDGINNLNDAFRDNACASMDTDDDGLPDHIIDPSESIPTSCTNEEATRIINRLAPTIPGSGCVIDDLSTRNMCVDPDIDGDGESNVSDVDDDNDGLIEIANETMLNNMQFDLDGTHLDDETDDSTGNVGDSTGCPTGGCNGYELIQNIALDMYADWTPVGNFSTGDDSSRLTGDFDGNGYVVSNLAINSDSGVVIGFFGAIRDNTIRNLRVIGSIMHRMNKANIGGLSGNSGSNVLNSSASVDITNSAPANNSLQGSIGGMIGGAANAQIKNSWSGGNITFNVSSGEESRSVGGLIGDNLDFTSKIENCYSAGTITGSSSRSANLGGLIGFHITNAIIKNSYSIGDVISQGAVMDNIGGLVANIALGMKLSNTTASYHSGMLTFANSGSNVDTVLPASVFSYTASQTASDLQTPTDATGIFENWSTQNWDFGTNSQYPILKFAEHSESASQDCTPASGVVLSAVPLRPSNLSPPYCGKLLPGQSP